MSSYLVEAATSLYRMSTAGVATQIPLPTTPSIITLTGAGTPLRTAVFTSAGAPIILCVNGATRDFYIDTYGVARSLQLQAPMSAPTAVAGTGAGMTGIYTVWVSYKVKDANGATIIESGLSPAVATASLANKTILLAAIPVSSDGTVNCRGLYRSVSGGTVAYPWFDIDDNISLTEERGIADSLLSLLPTLAARNGAPPDLALVAVWLDRVWGVPRLQLDHLRWTDDRNFYGWSADNEALIPPTNSDDTGATALIPRRGSIGITRRNYLYMIVGAGNDSFQRVCISETLGCVSQESVVVVENTAYMIDAVGVNEWSDNGIISISESQVDAWFTTDTYFNRSMFTSAQGRYNAETDAYELLLASAGSSVLDRWVSYHRATRTWYGPHLTNETTFTCAAMSTKMDGTLTAANGTALAVFGAANGFLYKRDSGVVNDGVTAVPFSVVIAPLSANLPDLEKLFLRPTVYTRQETGGTLCITPTAGSLEDPADPAMLHDLTQSREVLDRFGLGNYLRLTLTHTSTTERPRIYGIEVPYILTGRR